MERKKRKAILHMEKKKKTFMQDNMQDPLNQIDGDLSIGAMRLLTFCMWPQGHTYVQSFAFAKFS